MVTSARAGEAGKIRFGCLLSLVVVVAIVYYGIDFLRVRMRFYQMQDDVKTKASFAAVMDDNTIRRQLVAKADTLGLPLGPRQWSIRRDMGHREISIKAQYDDSVVVDLPGVHKVFYFKFTPQANNPF